MATLQTFALDMQLGKDEENQGMMNTVVRHKLLKKVRRKVARSEGDYVRTVESDGSVGASLMKTE